MKKPGLSKEEAALFAQRLQKHDFETLILIFTEGTKTEPAYFRGFKQAIEQQKDSEVLAEVIGTGRAALRLLEEADAFLEAWQIEQAEVWLVSDRDEFPARYFDDMIFTCRRLDEIRYRNCRWKTAWSNECFELWFVLHFSFYQAAAPRQEYFRILKREFRKRGLPAYEKNQEDLFRIFAEYGNPREAILYAKKLHEENAGRLPSASIPCTTVYELAEELAQYLPPDLQKKF